MDMGDKSADPDPYFARIQQLESERDELRKDIEQLCTQQAGPSYLLLATRMHFQRTAGLEQEILKLQKDLAECNRDRINLNEELSEASRIKVQLENLHKAEVAKKLEAEKQLKFFQANIASAFAERDNAFMEAEKAKEKEELKSRQLYNCERQLEERTSEASNAQELVTRMQADLARNEQENVLFKKIVDKFYQIRQQSSLCHDEERSYLDRCSILLDDPEEAWSFNAHREAETAECIFNPSIILRAGGLLGYNLLTLRSQGQSALEEERDSLKETIVNFQNKIRMGLDIERHLKRKVRELEKKKKHSDEFISKEISRLRQHHSEQRSYVVNLLSEGETFLTSILNAVEQKFGPFVTLGQETSSLQRDDRLADEDNSEDTRVRVQAPRKIGTRSLNASGVDSSKVLSQALQEKVSALMLLQQQEERHFLERNENSALLQRLGELQRSLNQVTAEKLEALMKLELLERKLLEKSDHESRSETPVNDGERAMVVKEGRFRNLLNRTSLKRLVGAANFNGSGAGIQSNNEGYFSFRRSNGNTDAARIQIENATLNESMRNLEHLTSQIYKLRQALGKAKEASTSKHDVEDIVSEANLVLTALSSSLPLSWSAEGDGSIPEAGDEDSGSFKADSVSAAGFEMVQLLLLAAQTMKDGPESSHQGV